MNKEALLAVQKREFEILEEIDRICQQHNINFVLIGGSCLGAVRHNNIIPWDDDIDIGMTRDNYEMFKEICKKELNSNYYFQDAKTDKYCSLAFGKVRDKKSTIIEAYNENVNIGKGIWVDIFPFDYISENDKERKKLYKRVFFLKSLINIKCGYKGNHVGKEKIQYNLIKFYVKFRSVESLKKKLDDTSAIQNSNKKYLAPYGDVNFVKEAVTVEMFHDQIKKKFGENEYNIFKDFDIYLTQIYGNYLELPPIEKRENYHGVKKLTIDGINFEV